MNKIESDTLKNLYTLTFEKNVLNYNGINGYSMKDNNCISLKLGGKFLFTSHGYGDRPNIKEEVLKTLQNNKEITKDYLLNNVNSMYRFPKLTLSRDKLSSLQEDCNFKVVRNRDKADMWVISDKTLEDITSMTYRDGYHPITILTLLNKYASKFQNNENTVFINDLILRIQQMDEDAIIIQEQNWYHDEDETSTDYVTFVKMSKELEDLKGISKNRGYIHFINDYNIYKELVINSAKIVVDTHINKLCVEDSVAFDKDDFERLNQLLKSGDKENINIALSLMANCNVEESKTVLSLIFAYYSENMKNAKVWNHVNFKYLRKMYERYINMSLSNWGSTYDHLIKCMCEDKCLNMWSSRYIANSMFVNVLQNNCGAFTSESVFVINIESLQLKDEYKDKITNDEQNISELVETFDDLPF
jgi:hypothetical protein